MSSEMRGFDVLEVARETGLRSHLHGVNATDARAILERFAIALLARTEARADGAVDSRAAFERWAKPQGYRLHIRDTPGSARLGQYGDDSTQAAWEAWTASRTTHPQDASGDAVTGRVNGYIFSARAIEIITDGEVPEWITKAPGLRVTITAMQAKEAK